MRVSFKLFSWALLAAAAAFSAYWLVVTARPLDERELLPDYAGEILGCDFYMRYNEIECLRSGLDPFLVWDEQIPHAKYVSNRHLEKRTAERYEPINAYTPWSYVFFMPLNLLPRTAAWGWYYALMTLSTLVWAVAAFRHGVNLRGEAADGAWVAALALFVGPALATGLICANYTVVLAGAFAVLAWGLNRGGLLGETLAGASLALAMTKPQLALLATLPLLMKGRWRVLALAAALCLAATALAASYCGQSVPTLILEAPQGNVFAFKGCGLMPKVLYEALVSMGLRGGAVLTVTALAGLAGAAAITWRWRREDDWLALLMPALVFSVAWTYVQPPSHIVAWLPLAVVAGDLLCAPSGRRRALDIALVFCLARLYYLPVKFLQMRGFSGPGFETASELLAEGSALGAVVLLFFFHTEEHHANHWRTLRRPHAQSAEY